MSRKKATIFTINSVTALNKVLCSSHPPFESFKSIVFVNNISTAAERSDFQTSNGFDYMNSLDKLQGSTGFRSVNSNISGNNVCPNGESGDFDGNFREISRNEFQGVLIRNENNETGNNTVWKNPPGAYGVSNGVGNRHAFNGHNRNSIGYAGENFWSTSSGNPDGLGEKYGGMYGGNKWSVPQNGNDFYAENLTGLGPSSTGNHGQNRSLESSYRTHSVGVADVPQNSDEFYQQGGSGSWNNVSANCGGSIGQLQPSTSKIDKNNSIYTHIPGDYNVGNTGMRQQNPSSYNAGNANNFYQHGSPVSQEKSSGYYGGNMGQIHPSGQNLYSGSTSPYMGDAVTHQQCYINAGNLATFQQSAGGYQAQNTDAYQQMSNNPYVGNSGMCQPSQNGYQQESFGSLNYHENTGVSQANSGGYLNGNVGHYQQKYNEFQNTVVDSQASTSNTPDGKSVEDNCYNGTLEELDSFCKEGKVKETVEVLGLLDEKGISVDLNCYLLLMKVCGDAKALEEAKAVHEHVVRSISPLQISTYNRIIEMYAKCGSMDDAYDVFSAMPERNLTSWDTMIAWLGKNGLGEDAIDMFSQFKEAGLKPDGQMFIGVFAACGVLGDVDEGMLHFDSMSKVYGIVPSMEHYVSIVDMLGSTGYLNEALEFIEKMPMEPSVELWETLMNLCRVQGNMELGDRCAEIVEQQDPSRLNKESKAGLVPLIPSDIPKQNEKKKASQNILELKSKVHEYRAGDRSHPDSDKIYALLKGLKEQLKEAGYIPETRFVLHDIDQEGKEEALMAHSERLATAQGLLSCPARSPIRVIKNLRVCVDCHNAIKIISKLVGRELVMRDAKRFHHFKDGKCSCNDYW